MTKSALWLAAAAVAFTAGQAAALPQINLPVAVGHQQLRVYVSPVKGDPSWNVVGVTFEKQASCVTSSAAEPSAKWPVDPAQIQSSGDARAPLFNPGTPNPDGTYGTGADDGFNTIYVPVALAATGKTLVCRGRILANGRDVTLDAPDTVAADSYGHIASTGPETVHVGLDPAKLKAVPRTVVPIALPGVPKIVKQGFAFVHIYASFDPDTGAYTYPGQPLIEAGIRFSGDFLSPQYSIFADVPTVVAPIPDTDEKTPSYAHCQAALKSDNHYGVFTFKDGDVRAFCVRTKGGRTAELFVDSTNVPYYSEQGGMGFHYTIWDRP